MNSITSNRILKAALGAILAAGLITAGTASADRGGLVAAAPDPDAEVVLGYLDTDDDDTIFLRSTPVIQTATGGSTVATFGTNNYQAATTTTSTVGPATNVFKAGPGCSIQCITSGVAFARGPNAKLVVKTDTLARIWIHVQGPNGYYRVENSGADEVMEFGVVFDDLQAGTTYQAWAVAKDKQNFESEAHGGFTTRERNVDISFSIAYLQSHHFANSDYKMAVWLQGQFDDDHTVYNLPAEGNVLPLGIHFIDLNDVDRYLDFAIQLHEAPDTCNSLGVIDNPYYGQGGCAFLSFASLLEGENDLDARPAGADSWTEWTLERTLQVSGLLPAYDSPLIFEVPVTLKVTYTEVF